MLGEKLTMRTILRSFKARTLEEVEGRFNLLLETKTKMKGTGRVSGTKRGCEIV